MTRLVGGRPLLFGCVVAFVAAQAGWFGDLARAATGNVSIVDFSFNPTSLTVNVGDTVTWTNNDFSAHTTTSDTALWDSGALASGHTFSFTFTSAGTFDYHCNIHPFMHGTIQVVGNGATATFTPAPTPTPVIPVGPEVRVSASRDAPNQMLVTISARQGESLSQLSWTLPANAAAEALDGTPLPTGVTLPAGSTSTAFHLRRLSGQSVTLRITAIGSFGSWKTFVGGGPNAW